MSNCCQSFFSPANAKFTGSWSTGAWMNKIGAGYGGMSGCGSQALGSLWSGCGCGGYSVSDYTSWRKANTAANLYDTYAMTNANAYAYKKMATTAAETETAIAKQNIKTTGWNILNSALANAGSVFSQATGVATANVLTMGFNGVGNLFDNIGSTLCGSSDKKEVV